MGGPAEVTDWGAEEVWGGGGHLRVDRVNWCGSKALGQFLNVRDCRLGPEL